MDPMYMMAIGKRKIKIPSEKGNDVQIDSPKPGKKRRSTSLVCKTHDLEEKGFEIIAKTCRLAIRRYIDAKWRVEFGYCPELEQDNTIQIEVKSTESQMDITDPAMLNITKIKESSLYIEIY